MSRTAFHLIRSDAFDREAWDQAKRALGPAFEALQRHGDRLLPHFEALVEDLFCALFKLVVQVVPEPEAPPSTLLSREILRALLQIEAFAALKEQTALDLSSAAQGALALARRALALIKSGEVLLEGELANAQALARIDARLLERKAAAKLAQGTPLEEALNDQIGDGEQAQDELASALKQSVAELPARFAQTLSRTAENLEADLPERDEAAQKLARDLGAPAPSRAAERLALGETLRTAKKLGQLAALAGAFRASARAARKKHRERASEELYRVGQGRELSRVLPSELMALRDPLRRRDFLRRFAEGQLGAYELRGTDRHGRGPLVVCLDGSGSMSGPRELWSKAVALALVEIARRQNRKVRALVFSGPEAPVQAFELVGRKTSGRAPVSLAEVAALAECFPGGGTDFQKPLQLAAEAVCASRFKGGDVVFITDGEAQLSPAFVDELNALKKTRGFAIYGVVVDDPGSKNVVRGAPPPERAIAELRKVADEVTTVSRLTADSVRGLFEAL